MPLYPLGAALYPVASLYAANFGYTSLQAVGAPALWCVGGVVLAWLGCLVVTREVHLSAVLASIWALCFFSFGHLAALFESGLRFVSLDGQVTGRDRYLIPAFLAITLYWSRFAVKRRHIWRNRTAAINVLAVLLIGLPVSRVIGGAAPGSSAVERARKSLHRGGYPAGATLPDIFYIILDGYGREDVLRHCFSVDNGPFIRWLQKAGFEVPPHSRSNYSQTFLSIASSVNVRYLNELRSARRIRSSGDWAVAFPLIRDNVLERVLWRAGYTIYRLPSGWEPSERSAYADQSYNKRFPSREFAFSLLRTSVLRRWSLGFQPFASAEQVIFTFYELVRIAHDPRRTFALAHIIAPHPPYVFRRDGSPVPFRADGTNAWRNTAGYAEEVEFLNAKLRWLVKGIFGATDTTAVIVIQSDHGPECGHGWDPPSREFEIARLGILNAIFLPGEGLVPSGQALTPVNTFRLVLSRYLHKDLPLLPDSAYFAHYNTPFDFRAVSPGAFAWDSVRD